MTDPAGTYRVDELAAAAELSVDTVRYYQGQGLLPPPKRSGRIARYGAGHLERLREVRSLAADGFTLAQIRALLADSPEGSTLRQLANRGPKGERLDRDGLVAATDLDRALVDLSIDAGLLRPVADSATEQFGPDAVEMLQAASTLLSEGILTEELAVLAGAHATHVEALVADAVELVVGRSREDGLDGEALIERFDRLAPVVTTLVARHFEQALLSESLRAAGAAEIVTSAAEELS